MRARLVKVTDKWTVRLTAALAFAVGVAVGVFCGRGVSPRHPVDAMPPSSLPVDAESLRGEADRSSTPDAEGLRVHEETTVEVTYADTSGDDTSPEVTAAHRARRARRAAAREANAEKRREFLSKLNLDLLSADQQKLHAEYTEAVAVRDGMRRQIRDLRAKGEDVPVDFSKRLVDAESVVRADAAEEQRVLRAAAARAHGLDDAGAEALIEDLASIDSAMGLGRP